ncbi:copper resistance protein CopC [Agreia sp. PsM10]|uniref:copper resistance CopC family protein n=1 Tax=Agreia sp. PsM10 TaxID=3030533 RepID=UPI00263BAAED|nr:copper resistance CopC family protein [Agreia sp. PsM10]MDN4641773.1 copper resistance protein CopC [Agreia sp. PsM10]
MRIARPKPSARRAAAVGALALLAAVTVGAVGHVPTASAHNYLVSSTPEAGSVLTSLPPEFVITTNDVLLDFGGENTGSAGALEVQGPDGLFYGDGCVAVSGASISTPAAIGPAGDYTVIWRVVSTDGHPVSSQFSFTWQPDAAQVASAGSTAAPVCPTSSDAAGAVDGAGAASGDSEADSPAPTAGSSDDEFLSVLAWGGGALGAVAIAVVATLLVLRRPKLGAGPGSDSRPPGDI